MAKFKCIDLKSSFNSPALLQTERRKGAPAWNPAAKERNAKMPRGKITAWGMPFRLGSANLARKGLITLAGKNTEVTVGIRARATHVCFLHFSNGSNNPQDLARTTRKHLADYVLRFSDRTEFPRAIRQRFEINPFAMQWGFRGFATEAHPMTALLTDSPDWGPLQTGVLRPWPPDGFETWVYALENPEPQKTIGALELRAVSREPVGILGITLYNGPGHPLRHVARRLYKLTLPPNEKTTVQELTAEIDLGYVTRAFAMPVRPNNRWLKDRRAGLGAPRPAEKPGRRFLLEATGSRGADISIKAGKGHPREVSLGEAFDRGSSTSADGKVRVELIHPRSTWIHLTVKDSSTGKPTPVRIHFRGHHGEYLPPHGHHAIVNERWFEDYGAELQLGATSYAYVPGKFQIELPVGEVHVELTKGFEYVPLRKKVTVRPGQRQLELEINRWTDLRKYGWITADTHVHFISPQTAWLEGQCEGLNLINLLASQWGKLFTNVGDITGELSGASNEDMLVWVGTENRHHLLGHISLLGTHGDPVFPMCTGGPSTAYVGDADITTLTEWAETCRKREGIVIRPHFPHPTCEEPAYFALGKVDGIELRSFGDPASGSLEEFRFQEWYRYLNCGYRVAAVGGTDKMMAGMPVGGVRTYARLGPDEPFTFASWARAVRAGRTYTTSGPLIDITVDGRRPGDEIQMPSGGGIVEIEANADSAWPIHALEVVINGRVAARAENRHGAKRLNLHEHLPLKGSCWVAARCGSRLRVHHCWPIQLGAHTSPVYIVAGGEQLFSPSDAAYMLTLLDGGLTWLDTLSVRYSEERHAQMKAIFEKARQEILKRHPT